VAVHGREDTILKRRAFLGLTAAGVTLPGFIAEAMAQDGERSEIEAPKKLDAALQKAGAAGKPLVVFVAPAGDQAGYDRGQLLGALFAYGSDGLYLDLALFEVVCLSEKEARVKQGAESPLAIIHDTRPYPDPPRTISAEFPVRPEHEFGTSRESARKDLTEWVAPLVKRVREGLVPDSDHLRAYARQASFAIGEDRTRRAERWKDLAGNLTLSETIAATAILRVQMEASHESRDFWKGRLNTIYRERLWDQAPTGARWAKHSGCGITIEGEARNVRIGCGMGHIPEGTRRFLVFYTE